MNRAEAVRLAIQHANAKPESYVGAMFKPHAWVIYAILEAAELSEAKLVEFFREPAAASLAQEGDDNARTPTQQAIHSLYELLRLRQGVERTRRRGKTPAAVLDECDEGHKFYRVGFEGHVTLRCPDCLAMEVDKLRSKLRSVQNHAVALNNELRG